MSSCSCLGFDVWSTMFSLAARERLPPGTPVAERQTSGRDWP
ncbi:Uncharacterised protein [Mycobacteroides abscessus subsp. abscessus]|nr:Uncharacterised protein [Mycobacteroides abscessus subsp. abscessus]